MAKKAVDAWFEQTVKHSARLAQAGSIALIAASAFTAFLTWAALWVFIWKLGWGGRGGWGLNVPDPAGFATTGLVVIFLWYFLRGRDFKEEYHFSGQESGLLDWSIVRASGSVWTIFLLDPAAGRGFITMIASTLLIAPRSLALAWDLHQRAQRSRSLSLSDCTKIIRILMKSQSRVSLREITSKLPGVNPGPLVQGLTDIDGVVFIPGPEPALTLAPRLVNSYREWLETRSGPAELE